jgi:plastocyanin
MRTTLAVSMGLVFLVAAACSSSSTMVANSCGSSGASANISASDGLTFAPSTATITHGQSVCWQNNGSVGHTVTSNDGTSFNTSLPSGQIFVHTFATAGSFPYHCNIHAGMTGTITVN